MKKMHRERGNGAEKVGKTEIMKIIARGTISCTTDILRQLERD
jgi:hypothetical protein